MPVRVSRFSEAVRSDAAVAGLSPLPARNRATESAGAAFVGARSHPPRSRLATGAAAAPARAGGVEACRVRTLLLARGQRRQAHTEQRNDQDSSQDRPPRKIGRGPLWSRHSPYLTGVEESFKEERLPGARRRSGYIEGRE